MFGRNIYFALVFSLFVIVSDGFSTPRPVGSPYMSSSTTMLRMSNNEEDRLRALGYSEDDIRRSKKQSDPENAKVRVDLVDDVDAFSLTALGFALIAINFLVFANLGDGGIGGIVATFINTIKQ